MLKLFRYLTAPQISSMSHHSPWEKFHYLRTSATIEPPPKLAKNTKPNYVTIQLARMRPMNERPSHWSEYEIVRWRCGAAVLLFSTTLPKKYLIWISQHKVKIMRYYDMIWRLWFDKESMHFFCCLNHVFLCIKEYPTGGHTSRQLKGS